MLSNEYAAGLFDGEGYVGVNTSATLGPRYHALHVTVTNTSKGVLDRLQERWGGSVRPGGRPPNEVSGQTKTAWVWSAHAETAKAFLRDVESHLQIKGAQARIALAFPLGARGAPVSDDTVAVREAIRIALQELKRSDVTPWQRQEVPALRDDPQVQEAIALYQSGVSAREVGKQIGVNASTVGYWLRHTGTTRSRSDATRMSTRRDALAGRADVAEAVRLYRDEGLSVAEVGRRLGRPPGTINNWLRAMRATRTLSDSQTRRRVRERTEAVA
jgi:transposase-like protein